MPSLTLESHHLIVLGDCISGVHGRAKFGILACQVFIRDPTGTGTKSSNSNRYFMTDQELHQLLQGWYADSLYLLCDVIFDQRGRFPHEDDTWLMAPINGSLSQKERKRSIRWVIGAVSANVKNFSHTTFPSGLCRL